ncbi:Uma2 family endonuclease [Sphingomonas qilianensis]|uniref:Uma2 family endonuclease n=1 Tax=Sphingomonas qilianensis TaxID=1736690 RepID=A0ABU9XRH1_9SPHN
MAGCGSICGAANAAPTGQTWRPAHDQSIRKPDVSLFCNDRRDDDIRSYDDPRMLFEILSAGTPRTDLRTKPEEYKALDSVDTIVFVDTAAERLRIVQRTAAHGWRDMTYQEAADVPLPSLNMTLPHNEIFARG